MKREDLISSIDIGGSLKKLREEKGLTQEELAKGICDRTTITKLEKGLSKIPSFIFVVQLCERLDIDVNQFLNSSLKGNYIIDKEKYVDYLLSDSFDQIESNLKNINYNLLNNEDKIFYDYLNSKISLRQGNLLLAKKLLLKSLKDSNKIKLNYSLKSLAYFELINNNLITKESKSLMNIYFDTLLKEDNKDICSIYLYNILIKKVLESDDMELANLLLEKQINTINKLNKPKYLTLYYKNKLKLIKNDKKLTSQVLSKLNAINKVNKSL